MNEQLNELLKDEEFLKAFINVSNPDDLKMLLDEKGIVLDGITPSEAYDIIKQQENAELTEDSLDNVNGGIAVSLALSSAALLTLGAGGIAFLAGYGYQKWKRR